MGGSIFSRYNVQKMTTIFQRRLVTIYFGKPLQATTNVGTLKDKILDMEREALKI